MLLLEVSALSYLLVMLTISIGWYLNKVFIPKTYSGLIKVSLIVAVRNEAANIKSLLVSISNQTYPKDLFEFIIVDDKSEDKTIEIIEKFRNENPELSLTLIRAKGQGKKQALKQGIRASNGEIIISTDGDCKVQPDWIKNYISFFGNSDAQMVFGPVFYSNKNFLQKLFSLEFATLVAAGAASAGVGLPLMGNGANLAFRKQAYENVEEKLGGKKLASGDDVFLMHSIASNFGKGSLKFIKNEQSVVTTSAPDSINKFVNQRIRWGSKAKSYKSIWALTVSLVVFLFSLFLGVTALLAFYKLWFLAIFVLFIILKFLIDFPLSNSFLRFYDRQKLVFLLFPMEFIYPFYIIVAAIFSIFIPYKWKGRQGVK